MAPSDVSPALISGVDASSTAFPSSPLSACMTTSITTLRRCVSDTAPTLSAATGAGLSTATTAAPAAVTVKVWERSSALSGERMAVMRRPSASAARWAAGVVASSASVPNRSSSTNRAGTLPRLAPDTASWMACWASAPTHGPSARAEREAKKRGSCWHSATSTTCSAAPRAECTTAPTAPGVESMRRVRVESQEKRMLLICCPVQCANAVHANASWRASDASACSHST